MGVIVMLVRTFGLVLAVTALPLVSMASAGLRFRPAAGAPISLAAREGQLWNLAVHNSDFADMTHIATRSRCEAIQPPLELATPDPLLEEDGSNARVTVSFIVGTDGRVHDPLVLESSRPEEDSIVQKVIGCWRYRPATCNGVATETEAKIAFSSR
jgi:hypothetical protein